MVGYEIRNTHTLPRAHDYDKDLLYKLKDDTEDILEQVTDLSLNVPILDQSGLIPASYLPSYVDDVLEYPSYNSLPTLGETGKIYVTTDTDLTYRWSGSTYIEISKSIITGVKGDAESNYRVGNVNITAAHIGLANVANIDLSKAIKTITRSGTTFTYTCLDGTTGTFTQLDNNTTYSAGTGLSLSGTTFSLALTKTLVTNALGYTPPTLDTNTWRPLGTGANDACAGNDSRLSNSRPASDVYAWAKAATKPSYSWSEITSTPTIPSKTSQLINDSGFITSGSYLPLSGGTISGDLAITGKCTNTAGAGSAFRWGGSGGPHYIGNNGTEAYFYSGNSLGLGLATGGSWRLYITNKGTVSIGSTSPAGDGSYKIYVSGSGYFESSVSASTCQSRSDLRLKDVLDWNKNIDINVIASAPILTFKWKDSSIDNKVHIGTSAQYWNEYLPEAVSEELNGYLSMDYGSTALASSVRVAKEVVELKEKIKLLEEENKQLKEELELLKSLVESILTTINIKSSDN